MIRDQQNDPNISPFQYTPLYPALISILEDISAQVAYGSLSPTLADQYMQYIMTGWSEALYYFQSTNSSTKRRCGRLTKEATRPSGMESSCHRRGTETASTDLLCCCLLPFHFSYRETFYCVG